MTRWTKRQLIAARLVLGTLAGLSVGPEAALRGAAVPAAVPAAFAAVTPEEQLEDPALEARARALSKELRCVVCDNQSIDDSEAQIAVDMRRLVRERLLAGDSDAEIRAEIVGAYGEAVLLQPRFSLQNLFIWATPALALALGGFWFWRRLDHGGAAAAPAPSAEANQEAASKEAGQQEAGASNPAAPLTDAEAERLRALLERDPGR